MQKHTSVCLEYENRVFIHKLHTRTHEKTYDCNDFASCIFIAVKQYLKESLKVNIRKQICIDQSAFWALVYFLLFQLVYSNSEKQGWGKGKQN